MYGSCWKHDPFHLHGFRNSALNFNVSRMNTSYIPTLAMETKERCYVIILDLFLEGIGAWHP
jgi:hypothetical protein